ncbi:MAG: competence protein ComEC family protein [Prevotellaceae bacterium]|jgi:competence protein ComEC|nr:competence protein ComEC family protein [Prevotellaceae bacterium]
MNFLQRTPFVRLLAALVAGIILFQFFPKVSLWVLLPFVALSLLLFLLPLLFKTAETKFAYRWSFGAGVVIFLVAIAFFLSKKADEKADFTFSTTKNIYLVELTGAPVEKKTSYMVRVKLLKTLNSIDTFLPASGNAIVYVPKDSTAKSLLYGDRLLLEAQFQPPQPALNPDAFDYGKYLRRQGVGATAYVGNNRWEKVGENGDFSLFRTANRLRNYLLQIYRELGLTGNEFAVVAALTIGYTDEIDPDLMSGYNASGAVHILSVSGLHVGIIYGFLLVVLGIFFKNSQFHRIFKGVVIVLLLWAYAFLTGLSPSVIRSAFMFSFVALALCFERKSDIYNSIFASAFIMLLINPNNLFQIGFQLSYAAVLSIVFFSVAANKVLKTNNKIAVWAWDMFAVSITAQLGTVPFVLYYFHSFPTYFLITNFLAIPLSSIIIYLSITTLALSFVPILSGVLAFVLENITSLLNFVILTIQSFEHSVLPLSVSFWQMWLLVAMLVFFCVFHFTKQFSALLTALSCILAIVLINIAIKTETLNTTQMIVYSGQRNTHVSFINGAQNTVFTTDSTEIIRLAKNFWDNNKLENPKFIGTNGLSSDGFIEFEGKRIFIQTDDFFRGKMSKTPLKIDYLILGAFQKPRIAQLLQLFNPKQVIICNGISAWYSNNIKQVCAEQQIPVYAVAEQGAYIWKVK